MTPALDLLAAIRAALPPSNWGALADCDALERWIRDEPKRQLAAVRAAGGLVRDGLGNIVPRGEGE